jgi:hypothetical protein
LAATQIPDSKFQKLRRERVLEWRIFPCGKEIDEEQYGTLQQKLKAESRLLKAQQGTLLAANSE